MNTADPGPARADEVPGRHVTINQVVAYNVARWRKAAGLTQEQLGQRLGGWSVVTVSQAERSWDGKKIRHFDAHDLIAIAMALDVPLAALFLPPDDTASVRYLFHVHEHGAACSDMAALFALLMPDSAGQGSAEVAYQKALAEAVSRYLDPERGSDLLAYLGGMSGEEQRSALLERLALQREVALSWIADIDQMTQAAGREQP